MATRRLDSSPRILPLYARAVAPLLPGASRLPWVGGGGGEVPELRLILSGVRGEHERVARYASVCDFAPSEWLPATYVHVLAFPLHLALMADGRFPFPAIGLVHVSNCIVQHRPIGLEERLDLQVHGTPLHAHPRGNTFSIVSRAFTADELVWEETSTMLHRGGGGDGSSSGSGGRSSEPRSREDGPIAPAAPGGGEQWRLAGDLGRRYAAVSGDRNPIHLHPLSARALGFPRAIAHGMWTKARCLAALQHAHTDLRDGAFAIEVSLRRAILLPATVRFDGVADGDGVAFGVRDAGSDGVHLAGLMRLLQDDASLDDTAREREEAR
jgi:hypothetical protein